MNSAECIRAKVTFALMTTGAFSRNAVLTPKEACQSVCLWWQLLRAIEKLKCYVSRNKQTRLQRSTKNGSNRLYECPAIPSYQGCKWLTMYPGHTWHVTNKPHWFQGHKQSGVDDSQYNMYVYLPNWSRNYCYCSEVWILDVHVKMLGCWKSKSTQLASLSKQLVFTSFVNQGCSLLLHRSLMLGRQGLNFNLSF